MKKRLIASILAVVLVASMVTGCGGKESSNFESEVGDEDYYSNEDVLVDYKTVDDYETLADEEVTEEAGEYKNQTNTSETTSEESGRLYDYDQSIDSKLLVLGLQTQEVDFSETAPSNLVFLLDVSGSMYDEDKLPLLQESFCLLAENLTEKDRVSIVTYAGADEVLIEGVKVTKQTLFNMHSVLYRRMEVPLEVQAFKQPMR